MIFDTTTQQGIDESRSYLDYLISRGAKIEILHKQKRRTLAQNNYLHLILSYFALEYGETLEYVKQEIFKKKISPDIFKTVRSNRKTLAIREDWRSTAKLDKKELKDSIDRFKNWSSKIAGIRLPDANEDQFLDSIKNEIERNIQYL